MEIKSSQISRNDKPETDKQYFIRLITDLRDPSSSRYREANPYFTSAEKYDNFVSCLRAFLFPGGQAATFLNQRAELTAAIDKAIRFGQPFDGQSAYILPLGGLTFVIGYQGLLNKYRENNPGKFISVQTYPAEFILFKKRMPGIAESLDMQGCNDKEFLRKTLLGSDNKLEDVGVFQIIIWDETTVPYKPIYYKNYTKESVQALVDFQKKSFKRTTDGIAFGLKTIVKRFFKTHPIGGSSIDGMYDEEEAEQRQEGSTFSVILPDVPAEKPQAPVRAGLSDKFLKEGQPEEGQPEEEQPEEGQPEEEQPDVKTVSEPITDVEKKLMKVFPGAEKKQKNKND